MVAYLYHLYKSFLGQYGPAKKNVRLLIFYLETITHLQTSCALSIATDTHLSTESLKATVQNNN